MEDGGQDQETTWFWPSTCRPPLVLSPHILLLLLALPPLVSQHTPLPLALAFHVADAFHVAHAFYVAHASRLALVLKPPQIAQRRGHLMAMVVVVVMVEVVMVDISEGMCVVVGGGG